VTLKAHGVVPTEAGTTTDLWVFEGTDGRDYAYTGTMQAATMYAWDVTDPTNPVITDSVKVDGRRANDVKINADATIAVMTSERASNRRNGITIVDISDPSHPRKITHFTEGLTGGVHNVWIERDIVYAVHNGTNAVHIVDISDPANPSNVGRWQVDNPARSLHDIIVQDGLAYLSYWDDGLVILDVGAGIAGGTPTEPVEVSRFTYRSRWGAETYGNTHHAIRYKNYVFVADEIFGCSECVNGPRGHVHVIDVTDIEEPREVANYRVPEAGAHNLWVEDDKLYVAYYQAGLRVVDISGELRGDLYRQGREIGWYMTEDTNGYVPNSTDSWGPQPYKGNIFVSDAHSGLWIVELDESRPGLVP
jgi:choice-of-anchor B domain-containing protein